MSEQIVVVDAAQISSVLEKISANLEQAAVPWADRLWSVADIAVYVQLSEFTVGQRIVTLPGFPEPIGMTSKRWLAADVVAWAKNSKGRLPKPRKR